MLEPGSQFELTLLGRFDLRSPDGPIRMSSKKLAALLAFLASRSTSTPSRDQLATLLWGSHFEEQARQNLRQALARLRRILGADAIVGIGDTISLRAGLVSCDAVVLETLIERGGAQSLSRAVGLYRGLFLSDIAIPEAAWTDWLEGERRRFETLIIDALVGLARLEIEAKHPALAQKSASRAAAIDPFREDAHREVMRALAASGQSAGALKHYAELEALLQAELGARPDHETSALAAAIRMGESHPVPAWAPPAADSAGKDGRLRPATSYVADLTAHESAQMAILIKHATLDQQRQLGDLIAGQSVSVREASRAGADCRWVVETASASEAARLVFEIQMLQRAMAAGSSGSVVGMGLHAGSPVDARLSRALAETAESGQCLATEDVRDRLVDRLDAQVTDLGFVDLHDRGSSVRAFSLSPPVAPRSHTGIGVAKLRPVIAVLPFSVAADQGQHAIAGELIADEIINASAKSKQLDVISRLSTRQFAGRAIDLHQISSHLATDYVVIGHSQTTGSRVELIVELAEAASGIVKWSSSLHASLAEPLAIREAAEHIAAEVLAAILISETDRASSRPMSTLGSYTLLFAAISMMDRWTRSNFLRSRELLSELLERAPRHPLPNAWQSAWHIRSISQGWSTDIDADGRAALSFAQRSLDLDPNCSIALAMDGWAHVYGSRRLDIANERLAIAVDINPNDSLAWLLKGVTHAFVGEGQSAGVAAERALRLSPLDPRRSYYEAMAATAELAAKNYEHVIEYAQRSLKANRLHASTLRALAVAQWQVGRHDDARQTVAQLLGLEPGFTIERYMSHHPAMSSDFGRAAAEALRAAGVPSR